jgi:hypothetical protein
MWFQNKQFLFYFAFTLANFTLISSLLLKNKQNSEIGKLAIMYIIALVIMYYIIKWLINNNYDTFTWFLVVLVPLICSYYYITTASCALCYGVRIKLF